MLHDLFEQCVFFSFRGVVTLLFFHEMADHSAIVVIFFRITDGYEYLFNLE